MSDKQPLPTESYKGVRDFYPADWAKLSAVFEQSRAVLRARGYEEYQASPLEHSELYESKGNEEIINEQTFSFEDRGGRRVTLRPEMTPTLARMVAGKRRELAFPLRWFSIGNRFRYERPQKGRLREFFQTDVDLIGLPEGEADIEIISIAHEILTSFGATKDDFTIRINHRKLFERLAAINGINEMPEQKNEIMRKLLRLVDAKDKMPAEKFEQGLEELGFPKNMFAPEYFAAKFGQELGIETLLERLKSIGIVNVVWDATVARGFDYYTGIVFEVNDASPENPRALFGGGRYDGLVTMFGGEAIPAVGFAFGDVTMLDFLETHQLTPAITTAPQLYIGTLSADDIKGAQAFAAELRAKGIRVFVNLTEKKIGDQIKDAARRFIPYFLAYGKDEAKSKKARVKQLASGTEKKVSLKDVAKLVGK